MKNCAGISKQEVLVRKHRLEEHFKEHAAEQKGVDHVWPLCIYKMYVYILAQYNKLSPSTCQLKDYSRPTLLILWYHRYALITYWADFHKTNISTCGCRIKQAHHISSPCINLCCSILFIATRWELKEVKPNTQINVYRNITDSDRAVQKGYRFFTAD